MTVRSLTVQSSPTKKCFHDSPSILQQHETSKVGSRWLRRASLANNAPTETAVFIHMTVRWCHTDRQTSAVLVPGGRTETLCWCSDGGAGAAVRRPAPTWLSSLCHELIPEGAVLRSWLPLPDPTIRSDTWHTHSQPRKINHLYECTLINRADLRRTTRTSIDKGALRINYSSKSGVSRVQGHVNQG